MSNNTVMYAVDSEQRYLKLVVLSGSPFSKGCICSVFTQEKLAKDWQLLGEVVISEKVRQGTTFTIQGKEVKLAGIFVQQF